MYKMENMNDSLWGRIESLMRSRNLNQKEFAAAYVEFLKKIRENNPDAPILCTLGIMGQTLCDAIDYAVTLYTDETGDKNISTMRFPMQEAADGYAVDWHPSAATHQKSAGYLSEYIRDWLKW